MTGVSRGYIAFILIIDRVGWPLYKRRSDGVIGSFRPRLATRTERSLAMGKGKVQTGGSVSFPYGLMYYRAYVELKSGVPAFGTQLT